MRATKRSVSQFGLNTVILIILGVLFFSPASCGGGGGGGGGGISDTTAPTVVATSPADNEANVPITAVVTATFSEAIDPGTVNNSNFTLDHGATGMVTYDAGSKTAAFTPATSLAYNTAYTATITASVKDLAGNALQVNKTWMFTTVPNPDATAPVTTATPPGGFYKTAQDVVLTANETATIYYTTDGSSPTVASSVYNAPIHIPATTTLKYFARDPAGNVETEKTETYTIDMSPPTVASTTPADGAVNVSANGTIIVVFSEDMSASTISTTTFILKDSANNAVSGTVGCFGTTAVFTPSTTLASSTTYTARVTTGVKDLAGNAMQSDYSWTFTTGIVPDTTPPTVVSTFPANGATAVAVTSSISATFSEAMSPSTINENTFYLRYGASGAFYSGAVSSSGVAATLTPVGMPYDALLFATITTGAKDLSGNALASNNTWSFRTALPPQGSLDTTFGTNGKVITDISGFTTLSGAGDSIEVLIIQQDDKIVAAGTAYAGTVNINDFALARYNIDGTLDSSFGTGGKVMNDFGGDDYLSGAVIQSDGKILAAGVSYVGCCGDFILARYNANGTVDTTFGTDGKVKTKFGTDNARAIGLGIQSSGKIVVAGSMGSNYSGPPITDFLARYNENGTPDTSFGTGGMVTGVTGKLVIEPDDQIVVLGGGFISRYGIDGALDTTFGSGGKAPVDINARTVAVQSDGKIVVGGDSSGAFALVRYKADGTLDGTFGPDGKVRSDFGGLSSSYAYAVAIEPDGKIVAAGLIAYLNSYDKPSDFALARYDADGTLDATFGTGGLATTDFNNGNDFAYALGIQSGGRIIAGGRSNADFALARY